MCCRRHSWWWHSLRGVIGWVTQWQLLQIWLSSWHLVCLAAGIRQILWSWFQRARRHHSSGCRIVSVWCWVCSIWWVRMPYWSSSRHRLPIWRWLKVLRTVGSSCKNWHQSRVVDSWDCCSITSVRSSIAFHISWQTVGDPVGTSRALDYTRYWDSSWSTVSGWSMSGWGWLSNCQATDWGITIKCRCTTWLSQLWRRQHQSRFIPSCIFWNSWLQLWLRYSGQGTVPSCRLAVWLSWLSDQMSVDYGRCQLPAICYWHPASTLSVTPVLIVS